MVLNILQTASLNLYRSHGAFKLYLLSFILSLVACLSLGILTLFSIFTDPFTNHLHYSQSIINNIIIFQTLGLNGLTPLCGYIADSKGIWILSAMSFTGYIIGFNMILLVYTTGADHRLMYLSFFIIGCSHGAFLFSCLLNCAKSFGRYYKTLSISTPNVMVAFSSFLQIKFMSAFLNNDSDPNVNFIHTLKFFLWSLAISSFVSLIACKLTDYIEFFEKEYDHSEIEEFSNFETSPLLTGAGIVFHSPQGSILGSPRSWYVDDSELLNLDDELSMLSTSTGTNYNDKIKKFSRDPLMYPLIFCCMISIGATEFFIANLSSILSNLQNTALDKNLQTFSVASTITRFLIMILTDYICTRFGVSRLTLISIIVLSCALSHLYLSSAPMNSVNVSLVVSLNAMLNSSVFTLFPAILASIYGIEILGTTWGVFSSSSIIGNLFLNLAYSFDFVKNCASITNDEMVICSTFTFFISGTVMFFFGLIVFALRGKYLSRAHEFF
ncbi:hypothetical protein CANARDRAFT_24073 [[Candida] arabinofermentans NRRL YB-2248]|uniref:Probable transporter MCH1 n=1 Tax=[Candida] arabinofermentans NRRL YB-2248 TaxID=983967 RepID=A0A1E4SXT0_9ASCO|nr:hypothetical protein CANARDRAFT_24073 [[Candida] arabinofermentans NRRL YB-2248]